MRTLLLALTALAILTALFMLVAGCGSPKNDAKTEIKAYLTDYIAILDKMATGMERATTAAEALSAIRDQITPSRDVKKRGDALETKYPEERKAYRTNFPEDAAKIEVLRKRIRAGIAKFEKDKNFSEELRKLGN